MAKHINNNNFCPNVQRKLLLTCTGRKVLKKKVKRKATGFTIIFSVIKFFLKNCFVFISPLLFLYKKVIYN